MARKEAFIIDVINKRIIIKNFDFEWYPGFAITQKQKSITSLHTSITNDNEDLRVLEVSTKSKDKLGQNLSAFNLTVINEKKGTNFTVESAFQGSKVFENGGPYTDLFEKKSSEAKKDIRLKNSGKLIAFQFFKYRFPLEPKTLFYDWLYLNTLKSKIELISEVQYYNVFTDIEFNSKKSINCQAKSVALFVLLHSCGLQDLIVADLNVFIEIYNKVEVINEDFQLNFDMI